MTITSFADNPLDQAGISGSSGALATMFNFFLAICVPVAIIGLAVSAFSFFLPNEKGWEVAKKRMLHIGLALMVLMLIPSIYKLSGGSAVQNAGWKAGETNSQIISRPAGSGEFDITDGPSAAS